MKNRARLLVFLLFAIASPLVSASAQKATVAFSALGISGSFGVKLNPITHAVIDLTNVSLSIDGHQYRNKDVGFFYDDVLNVNYIGGVTTGVDQLTVGSDHDFFVAWTPDSTTGYFSFTNPSMQSALSDFGDITVTLKRENVAMNLPEALPISQQRAPSALVAPAALSFGGVSVRRLQARCFA